MVVSFLEVFCLLFFKSPELGAQEACNPKTPLSTRQKNNNKESLFSQPGGGSAAKLCLTVCNPRDCSTPGFPVHQQISELVQTHVHRVGDAIQSSHPLLYPSPPAFNLSQHQDLFQWVSSSHQVAKVLEFQLQHQSFQWIFRAGFL